MIDFRALRRVVEATHDELIYRASRGDHQGLAALEDAKRAQQREQQSLAANEAKG